MRAGIVSEKAHLAAQHRPLITQLALPTGRTDTLALANETTKDTVAHSVFPRCAITLKV